MPGFSPKKFALIALPILALVVLTSLLMWRADHQKSSVQIRPATQSNPAPAETSTKSWPRWGAATNSAQPDGTAFFNRDAALAFKNSVDPKLRAYIVELNARSFLPNGTREEGSTADLFSKTAANSSSTIYLQFLNHPTPEQRERLKKMGVELLTYVNGYAWIARGNSQALTAAAALPFVRALAQIDPRDKLQRDVFLQRTPPYAQVDGTHVRFQLIAVPGTSRETLIAQLHSNPPLTNLQIASARTPSVLGPRFEIVARAELAETIARADSVLFVEYAAPPVAPRDATTDSTSNIAAVRDAGDMLDGSGINVAVRELGKPEQHVDFAPRMIFIDGDGDTTSASLYTHATAVVGQIASNGANQPVAKGVAPNVIPLIYSLEDSDFGTADVIDAATKNARISNHSYGPVVSSFGDYQSISADWDAALRSSDGLAILAGNEESDAAKYNHIDFFVGMKNGLCIEASSAQANAGNSSVQQSDGIANFAKFGPMNDGRVKPDLVAFGVSVNLDTGTNSVTQNSGTSFSTPATTGVAALVFQRYKAVYGTEPSAALAKALLCGSATDLGQPGPDSIYGFGIVNAQEAIRLIDQHVSSTFTAFTEDSVGNGDVRTISINVPAGTPTFKATVCWLDPAGDPAAAKALVNDLDMLLTDPNGATYFPYSLNAAAAAAAATNTGPNTVDPIEQTIIQNPVAGTWTVKITGTSIPSGAQPFAICSNVASIPPSPTAFILASPTSGDSPLNVAFDGSSSVGNIVAYQWDFGDGTTGTGASINHIYTFVPQTAATQKFTATLTVTDSQNNSDSATVVITVQKPSLAATPKRVSGTVNFGRTAGNSLQFMLIEPALMMSHLPAGSALSIRAGLTNNAGIDNLKTLFTFVVDAKGMQRNKNESIKLNARTGAITIQLKNAAPHDLLAFFKSLGIGNSTLSLQNIPMRVEVETDSIIYKADFTPNYKGRNGRGVLKSAN